MHQTHPPKSSLTMIGRHRCPKCQIRMMLVGFAPSFAGPDLRTFECPKCGLTYKALAEDPMKSNNAAGWLKSELRPPEQGCLSWDPCRTFLTNESVWLCIQRHSSR
jgi:hypothetical protein